jgi:alpha-glucosidase
MTKFKISIAILITLLLIQFVSAETFSLLSPNKKIQAKVTISDKVTYELYFQDKKIINPSQIAMSVNGDRNLCINPKLEEHTQEAVQELLHPVVKQKAAEIEDNYRELTLTFAGDYQLIFRAYDDGIAYRFVTTIPGDIIVNSESVNMNFTADRTVYFPEEQSFISHSEREYLYIPLSEITPERMCSLPVLVELENNLKVAVTEADLKDYPGLYLRGSNQSNFGFEGIFPKYPLKEEIKRDRDPVITERAEYNAKTKGNRSFPWRVIVVTDKDKDLIETQMIYKLSETSRIQDPSWIKPGKVAWDWWNWNNITGVDFRAGINTETYKYYIDFAADHGIEYVILDEGWYKLGNLLDISDGIDMNAILTHAQNRNVGIILWVIWKTLDDQLEPALNQFEQWGVKGIKVDFMQRDDQKMVNYYYKIAKEAAKRHMLVDFHGAYKPAGLQRTYPNAITREGVMGLENNKWSEKITPEHDLTIPFIRMLAGPVDYTPGAMINATKENFRIVFNLPMSQGTRCHQMAMYVVYESPLQMLADSPTHYLKNKECLNFIAGTPSVWDETRVLDAKVGDYVIVARRSGEDWFVGAMTDWTPRSLELELPFLQPGVYSIEKFQDGINADRNAVDYKRVVTKLMHNEKIKIDMKPGGGWVAKISKLKNPEKK